MVKVVCFSCANEMEFPSGPSRQDECPKCKNDVRSCKNCHFYDAKSYNECRENQADPVREKDRSNFCGFFQANSVGGASLSKTNDDLKKAAEALFKRK